MNTEYKIVLVNDTSNSGSNSPIAPTDQGQEQTKNTTNDASGGENNALNGVVKGYVFFKKNVGSFIKQGIQYQIGTVALRTGNHELQARVQTAYDIGSQAFGMVESVAIGAMTGGVWGAIAGAVMSLMHTAVTLSQKIETYNIQRSQEGTSIALMNVRAGGNVATTSGRRR